MILVAGATGFIGQALIKYLGVNNKVRIIAVVRKSCVSLPSDIKQVNVDNLLPDTDWAKSLPHIDVIIHLAARVHIMNDTNSDPLTEFRKINTTWTLNLARQAAKNGIRRFIFLCSVKVNGEEIFPRTSLFGHL